MRTRRTNIAIIAMMPTIAMPIARSPLRCSDKMVRGRRDQDTAASHPSFGLLQLVRLNQMHFDAVLFQTLPRFIVGSRVDNVLPYPQCIRPEWLAGMYD